MPKGEASRKKNKKIILKKESSKKKIKEFDDEEEALEDEQVDSEEEGADDDAPAQVKSSQKKNANLDREFDDFDDEDWNEGGMPRPRRYDEKLDYDGIEEKEEESY